MSHIVEGLLQRRFEEPGWIAWIHHNGPVGITLQVDLHSLGLTCSISDLHQHCTNDLFVNKVQLRHRSFLKGLILDTSTILRSFPKPSERLYFDLFVMIVECWLEVQGCLTVNKSPRHRSHFKSPWSPGQSYNPTLFQSVPKVLKPS